MGTSTSLTRPESAVDNIFDAAAATAQSSRGSTDRVIDFNELGSSVAATADPHRKEPLQPLLKKRKITIVSDAEKAKYERRKLAAAAPAPPCAAPAENRPVNETKHDKKEKIAHYLNDVRSKLETSKYAVFSQMTRTYRQDNNYEVLVSSLKNLFLEGSHFPHLFQGEQPVYQLFFFIDGKFIFLKRIMT